MPKQVSGSKPLSVDGIRQIANDPDLLSAVLKGHQCVEEVLGLAVSEALIVRHAVEVADLSFSLKVDLAIGLGLLEHEERGAFIRFNKARNGFAHKRDYKFSKSIATDLFNATGPLHRRMLASSGDGPALPERLLRAMICILYIHVLSRTARARDRRVEDAEWVKIVREVLPSSRNYVPHGPHAERVAAAVRASRAKRDADGDL